MESDRKIILYTPDNAFFEELAAESVFENADLTRVDSIGDLSNAAYDLMPHLIIADLKLSNIAGFDACQELKHDMVLEHIPVLLIADGQDEALMSECNADYILMKSNGIGAVSKVIKDVLHEPNESVEMNTLTRMPGSRSSVATLESVLQGGASVSVCSIVLKNFNNYRKKYGSQRSEALLRRAAEIIRRIMSEMPVETSFVGHLGINDFVAIVPVSEAEHLSERLIDEFEKLADDIFKSVSDQSVRVMMHVAIVQTGADGNISHISEVSKVTEQIQEYLNKYTRSVYLKDRRVTKRQSDDRVGSEAFAKQASGISRRPAEDIIRQNPQPAGLLADVVYFLKTGNVETHYQPIVAGDGEIHAYEALSRFKRSDGKFIEPIRMFFASREAGLVKEFDMLCAQKALENSVKLPAHAKLFMNLNRETLLDTENLLQLLDESPISTDRLVFEMTEQSLVRRMKQLSHSISELKRRGALIALDDAGGGSVSLQEAANLKPDYIKFDRSCITDIHKCDVKQKILASLMVFSESLGSKTVAEGIEIQEEWDYLMGVGITFGQGFFLARPSADPVHVIEVLKAE